ncbi:hypothetical protein [Vibrio aestuarianus]|uniref:Uncharacterized protein n=1 Tax=Vibrio aestuarianus TaxID=28171 RepID=A0A9X4IZU4_9VIBR|nr:hypothetical protein [Vibrio aestuarianus]MDE1236462.1 hypothetical protein [Vibrio aestuarianus]MDE1247340.1 hypothetical protein [Vibrio aestuarianus]MDE1330056.1 hypothetical protein [Vibrio aestuarianus]MDE1331396.1 hypothetical protein [Vibrio aestuarianus]MDE1346276.1 hypothetical protein [Vibrio aestuarianus]
MFKSISPPQFPQMLDDGVIDKVEIIGSGNNIDLTIPRYSSIQRGDSIEVYFNHDKIGYHTVDDINSLPLIFHIDALPFDEGIYPAHYTVRDWSDNLTVSPIKHAILLFSDQPRLPSPLFIDEQNDQLTLIQLLEQFGTRVKIPPNDKLLIGDNITLFFHVTDLQNKIIIASTYQYTYTVTMADITDGHIHLIPLRYLFVIHQGIANIHYIAYRNQKSVAGLSPVTTTLLNINEDLLTGPPIFVDAKDDGMLTDEEVANGIKFDISYQNMASNDQLTLTLYGQDLMDNLFYQKATTTVTQEQVEQGLVNLTLTNEVAHLVNMGYLYAYYELNNKHLSLLAIAPLNMELTLPPPTFDEAQGEKLFIDLAEDGTFISAAYPTMQVGQTVAIFLHGKDSSSNNVEEAEYAYSRTVSVDDIETNIVTFSIPAEPLLAVKENGTLFTHYSVATSDGITTYSPTESVTLTDRGIGADSTYIGGSPGYWPSLGSTIQEAFISYNNRDNTGPVTFTISAGELYFVANSQKEITVYPAENGVASAYISGTNTDINTIVASTNNNGGQSQIKFRTLKHSYLNNAIPHLEIKPNHNLLYPFTIVLLEGYAGKYNLTLSDGGTFIVDNENQGSEITNLEINHTENFNFNVIKDNKNQEISISVLDYEKNNLYCQIYF